MTCRAYYLSKTFEYIIRLSLSCLGNLFSCRCFTFLSSHYLSPLLTKSEACPTLSFFKAQLFEHPSAQLHPFLARLWIGGRHLIRIVFGDHVHLLVAWSPLHYNV